jgi:hypothetical protein
MEIPLMTDSENESIVLSEDTIIEYDDEIQVRAVADTELNPDVINLFLYEDEEYSEEEIIPEPKPTKIQKSKATTSGELENELIESVLNDSNIIQTLYLLHEHYANHKTATRNEKMVMKARILHNLSSKIAETKLKEFTQILNNFFN